MFEKAIELGSQLRGGRRMRFWALTEIYYWFTEGFDLPHLKAGKASLDELSC
jgi:hypothetical protein